MADPHKQSYAVKDRSEPKLEQPLEGAEVAHDGISLRYKLDRVQLTNRRLDGADRATLVEGLAELDHAEGFYTPGEFIGERDEAINHGRRELLTPEHFLEGDAVHHEMVLERNQLEERTALEQLLDLQQFLLDAGQAVQLTDVSSTELSHIDGLDFEGNFTFAEQREVRSGRVSGHANFTGAVVYADGTRSNFTNLRLKIQSAIVRGLGLKSAA